MSSAEAAEADSQNSHAFPVTSFHHHQPPFNYGRYPVAISQQKKANDLPESEFPMSGPAALTFHQPPKSKWAVVVGGSMLALEVFRHWLCGWIDSCPVTCFSENVHPCSSCLCVCAWLQGLPPPASNRSFQFIVTFRQRMSKLTDESCLRDTDTACSS